MKKINESNNSINYLIITMPGIGVLPYFGSTGKSTPRSSRSRTNYSHLVKLTWLKLGTIFAQNEQEL